MHLGRGGRHRVLDQYERGLYEGQARPSSANSLPDHIARLTAVDEPRNVSLRVALEDAPCPGLTGLEEHVGRFGQERSIWPPLARHHQVVVGATDRGHDIWREGVAARVPAQRGVIESNRRRVLENGQHLLTDQPPAIGRAYPRIRHPKPAPDDLTVVIEVLVVLMGYDSSVAGHRYVEVIDREMPYEARAERLQARQDLRLVPHDIVLVDLNDPRVEQPIPGRRIARGDRVEQRLRVLPQLGLDGRLRRRARAARGQEQRAKRPSLAAAP